MNAAAPAVQIQAILFDLDGTIIDTEPAAARALRDFFLGHGISITDDDAHIIIGRTWEAALTALHARYPLPVALPQALAAVSAKYRALLQEELGVVPGVVSAIRNLQEHYPLALVSGSLREEILWALQKVGVLDAFTCIFGGDEYAESKPSPVGFQTAMRKLGVSPEHVLIFEDSNAGVTAARRAGCWTVAVTGAHLVPQDVAAAHYAIVDFRGVDSAWIDEISQKHLNPKPSQV